MGAAVNKTKNTDERWSKQIARIKYVSKTTLNNSDASKIRYLNYANTNLTSVGTVNRVACAASSSQFIIRTQVTSGKVQYSIYELSAINKAFDEAGINYEKTAVGDKYVYENMVQNGHRIGGEQSGHIIFSKYATTGDGILTSMKMMEVMLAKKLPLSKLAEPVTIYPQVLKNVRVKSKPEAQNDPDVQEAVAKVAEMLGDTGRILVRESGTEPVIRVMVEAETESLCEKYVDQVIDVIKSKGHTA